MERPVASELSEAAQAYIAYQDKQIAELNQRVENLTNMFLNLQKQQYGTKSEKHSVPVEDGEQLSIFNEAEEAADPRIPDPTDRETEVKAHKRKRQTGCQEKLLEKLPVQEVEFELPEGERKCPKCEGDLTRIGREYIRTELTYIPAHVQARKYYRSSYACRNCSEDTSACECCGHADEKVCSVCPERPRTVFVQAAIPPEHRKSVMKHSIAGASSVANVLYAKYVLSVPLYRQVQEWKRAGVELSRQTLANWVLAVSRDWLSPMCAYLKKILLSSSVLHCDETTVQVLHEDGKKATSDSYMWAYRTGEAEKYSIVLFDYQPTRSGDAAKRFLDGFTGYFVADGYGGYNKVQSATRCGCWAHVRRKFLEAVPGTGQAAGCKAEEGVRFCDDLFLIERELKELDTEERQKRRLEQSKPIVDAFWDWIQTLHPLPKSALGKAIGYATGQKTCLGAFLLDSRIPISNNADENAIRPFVVGRKNWLFSNTPNGATASANVYSIVETAKLNGLDIYKYFCFLLGRLPVESAPFSDAVLEKLAPWSEFAHAVCS
jgi:transposase